MHAFRRHQHDGVGRGPERRVVSVDLVAGGPAETRARTRRSRPRRRRRRRSTRARVEGFPRFAGSRGPSRSCRPARRTRRRPARWVSGRGSATATLLTGRLMPQLARTRRPCPRSVDRRCRTSARYGPFRVDARHPVEAVAAEVHQAPAALQIRPRGRRASAREQYSGCVPVTQHADSRLSRSTGLRACRS